MPFGFIEKGGDVGGLVKATREVPVAFSVFGKICPFTKWSLTTWLKRYLYRRPRQKGGIGLLITLMRGL